MTHVEAQLRWGGRGVIFGLLEQGEGGVRFAQWLLTDTFSMAMSFKDFNFRLYPLPVVYYLVRIQRFLSIKRSRMLLLIRVALDLGGTAQPASGAMLGLGSNLEFRLLGADHCMIENRAIRSPSRSRA